MNTTAKKLRELVREVTEINWTRLENLLTAQAKLGRTAFTYHPKENESVEEIIEVLKEHGFGVKHHFGHDPRDGQWSYLDISW